jgi:flagellar motor switch protein FliN/FliY
MTDTTTSAAEPAGGHNEALFSKIDMGSREGRTREELLGHGRNLDSILRVPVMIQVVLGTATMAVSSLMKLGRGAIVPLDHRVGEPVDVVVNGRVIARGEVVVVEDDNSRFGVSLTEIMGPLATEPNA